MVVYECQAEIVRVSVAVRYVQNEVMGTFPSV